MFAVARRTLFALILAAGLSQPVLADGPQKQSPKQSKDQADKDSGQKSDAKASEKADAKARKKADAKARKKADAKARKKAAAKAGKKAGAKAGKKAKRPKTRPAAGKAARVKKAQGAKSAAPTPPANAATGDTDRSGAADRDVSAPLHRRARAGNTGLASSRQRLRGPRAAKRVKKDESQVERAKVEARQREVAKSPVESLLDELHGEVVRVRPKARGKINVSFRVGRGGVPSNVLILGFDDAIDVELEKLVQARRLPASYAGRQISTTLTFRGK